MTIAAASAARGDATSRPVASLSLDLDNQWSYMKTHGDAGWESYPSYLDVVVPRVLELLKRRGLTITFFVVGQDAALAKNREAIASIAAAGHEIGNHSYRHEPWLHLYSERDIDAELARTEDALEAVCGVRPRGFRGPGFSLSAATLRVLRRRGYAYDCSTFPTYLGPLARAYYFMTAKLTPQQREERRLLFGTFSEGLRPLKPYRWNVDGGELLEIPVTTMPVVKTPIHASYILYADLWSKPLATAYFRAGLDLCRATGTQPSILLHPLDFLGGDDVKELAFFPAMGRRGQDKTARVAELFDDLAARFTILPMGEHARRIEAGGAGRLPVREPRFSHPAPGSAVPTGAAPPAPTAPAAAPAPSASGPASTSHQETERRIR